MKKKKERKNYGFITGTIIVIRTDFTTIPGLCVFSYWYLLRYGHSSDKNCAKCHAMDYPNLNLKSSNL